MSDTARSRPTSVLAFRDVSTEPDPDYDSPLWDVTFELAAGDLTLVRLERGRERLPLADVAEGLLEPVAGTVTFLDEAWGNLSFDECSRRRGRIGRVFEGEGWLANLSVRENVTLARRHHSRRSEDDIEDEAVHLGQFFGLPGLPMGHVARTRVEDLRGAACVRAFLERPALVILERPTHNVFPVRDRGAVVLWTTDDVRVWDNVAGLATLHGTMFGSRMDVVRPGG